LKQIPVYSRLQSILGARQLFNNPIGTIDKIFDKFQTDTFRTFMGKSKVIMTKNPKVAKHVFQSNHKNYYKSEIQSELLARFVGKGLLTINGAHWLKQRRLIQPGFHKKNLDSFLQIMNQEVRHFVEQLALNYSEQKNTIDISKEMSSLTMRVVSRALFSSQIEEDEIKFIGSAVDRLQHAVAKDIRLPFLSWWRQLRGEERINTQISLKLYKLLQSKIDIRKKSPNENGDLLNMLLNVRYEDSGEGMSDQQLLDEILVLYAAGYETTANSLAWTFTLLAENPNCLAKLLAEIDNTRLSETLQMEELFQLHYTSKVASESLRLYPPAWMVDRLALEDDLVDGIKINKGEIINVYIFGIHRSEKFWDIPLNFDPDRFDPNTHKKSDFTYLPFGGGPRLCIGYQFAKLEISLTLYYLLRKFNLSLVKEQVIEPHPLITLKPKKGIKMILEKRKRIS